MADEAILELTTEVDLENDFNKLINNISSDVIKSTIIKDGDYIARKLESKLENNIERLEKKNNNFLKEIINVKESTKYELQVINNSLGKTYESVKVLFEENANKLNEKANRDLYKILNNINVTAIKTQEDFISKVTETEKSLKFLSEDVLSKTKILTNDCDESIYRMKESSITLTKEMDNISSDLKEIKNSTEKFNSTVEVYCTKLYELNNNVEKVSTEYTQLVDSLRKEILNINSIIHNKNQQQLKKLSIVEAMVADINNRIDLIEKNENKTIRETTIIEQQNDRIDEIFCYIESQEKKRVEYNNKFYKIAAIAIIVQLLIFIIFR